MVGRPFAVLRRCSLGCLALLACTACGESSSSDAGWTVRDSTGITIVENNYLRPGWAPGEEWKLSDQPRLSIGVASGAGPESLFQVRGPRLLSGGRIALIDGGSSEVRLFSQDGAFFGSVGRGGDGPGEFREAWTLYDSPSDSTMVLDLYREVAVFGPDGQFVREFVPERPDGQVRGEGFEPLGQLGDGSLLFRHDLGEFGPSIDGIKRGQVQMARVRADGTLIGFFGPFDDHAISAADSPLGFGAPADQAPADTTVWHGPGDRYEIQEVALDGRLLRLVRLDRPVEPVTEADIESFRNAMIDRTTGALVTVVRELVEEMDFSVNMPIHDDIQVDATGHLWVQDYSDFRVRRDRYWDVFNPEGRFLGRVLVPAEFSVSQIGSDFVLGTWIDELGVEYVRMYDLMKPE